MKYILYNFKFELKEHDRKLGGIVSINKENYMYEIDEKSTLISRSPKFCMKLSEW